MSTAERAYDRLVTANPIPDPERFMARDIDVSFRDFQEGTMDTSPTHEITLSETAPPPRRWRAAAAAFVAVVAVGGAVLMTTLPGGGDSVGDTPIDVVNAFFERWNDGDADAAMALVDPEVSIGGLFGPADLRGLIDFSSPFEGSMETDCSPAPLGGGGVECDWAWSTAGTRALDLATPNKQNLRVANGLITSIVPPNYQAWEGPLNAFADAEDPAGYSTGCSPDGVSPVTPFGNPHNERCGSFLASLEAAFVASLGN